jgi:hypothetical protein
MVEAHFVETDVDVRADLVSQRIEIAVQGMLYGETLAPHEYRHPDGWWQAFKDEHFPARAKRRWPVRLKTVRWDVKAVYRDFRPSIPNEPTFFAVSYPFEVEDAPSAGEWPEDIAYPEEFARGEW